MVKNEKGNILCRNAKGKDQYLSPVYIANKAIMERYGWVVIEEPQAPPVSVDEAIIETAVKYMHEELKDYLDNTPVTEVIVEKPKRTRKKKSELNKAA